MATTMLKHTQSADILFPEEEAATTPFDRFPRPRDFGYENVSHVDTRRHFRQRSYSQDVTGVTGRPWYNCRKLSAGATPPPPRPPPPDEGEGLLSRTDSRRRTWSPPAFSRMMDSAGSAMRSYHSNDQLDLPDENIYEELESVLGGISPCKLAPVSGKLTRQNAHRSLIKPVAFKPILPPPPHSSTPKRLYSHHPMMMSGPPSAASAASSHPSSSSYSIHSSPGSSAHPSPPGPPHAASSPQLYTSVRMPSLDDGYASQQDFHDRPLAVTYVSDFHSHMESASAASSKHSDMAASSVIGGGDSYVTCTPSPSDSGVGEVEALIRCKEEELAKLRDTMEKNEAAILLVHAERQQNWMMEMREVADEWERRLRAQQQKAFRSEQSLIMQLFRLQQERKQLKTDAEELRESRDALTREIAAVKRECDVLRSKADEASWELQQKAGEVSLLKVQLKEAKEDASSRSSNVLELKTQLREANQSRDTRNAEIARLKAESERTQSELQAAKEIVQQTQRQLEVIRQHTAAATAAPLDNQQLRDELNSALCELASVKSDSVKQREQWLEEKNKVIRYQKHLQLNYTQMHRKNKMLEAEIQQLTLELENRDIQLSDIQDDERHESMC